MRAIYSIIIRVYYLLILLSSIRKGKARLWIKGRKNWRANLRQADIHDGPIIWMHCASLGEFEQGRPVLESLRKSLPGHKFLLTFYSPSGYEIRKDYQRVDYVSYLPLDTRKNAVDFLNIVNPEVVLFVKYEFWPHFFEAIGNSNARLYMVSVIFRPGQVFFSWYGSWFRRLLGKVDCFFLQGEQSRHLLNDLQITCAEVTGDTRFDRVCELRKYAQPLPMIDRFRNGSKLVVLGSSWLPEEKLIRAFAFRPDCKVIIAPHEISESRMTELEVLFPEMIRYTQSSMSDVVESRIMVIDNIGLLSKIYQHADIAVIGGGFGRGVHNTLEAAVWGVPIIVGPNNKKFSEIQDLILREALFVVEKQEEFDWILLKMLQDEEFRKSAGSRAEHYVGSKAGATELICQRMLHSEAGES
jgi:3-deoxy-D-manno-octulosonic-acid transferase